MSHVVHFVHYSCGHSSPIGGSADVDTFRMCQACTDGYRPATRTNITPGEILGHDFSYAHLAVCEICATRIP